MNIFFDLDGTLIDARNRLYRLFQELVPQSSLTFEQYWELKKQKINHQKIVQDYFSYTGQQFLEFEKIWLDKIERPEWLALDRPFEGVTAFLENLKKEHSLFVVTARQDKKAARIQISNCGWDNIFEDIFVSDRENEKDQVIAASVVTNKNDWMVGDTGKDIQAGKKLGIHTAAVLTGFLSKEMLIPYAPDLIVESILDLKFDKSKSLL